MSWTPERRAQYAEAIRRWQPWRLSTGPSSEEGKVMSSRNADRGGQRQKLRAESKRVNALLRAQRELLDDVARDHGDQP